MSTDPCWGCPFMRVCPLPNGCPYKGGTWGSTDEQPETKPTRKESTWMDR